MASLSGSTKTFSKSGDKSVVTKELHVVGPTVYQSTVYVEKPVGVLQS